METCLGHVSGKCPECKRDQYNQYCPNYKKIFLRIFVVKPKKQIKKGVKI